MAISFKSGNATDADSFVRRGGEWSPDIHWIVPTLDHIEADFVQQLLDKCASEVEVYAILPFLDSDTFSVELQFRNKSVADQCRAEYQKGFAKGGCVPKAKKAKPSTSRRRIFKNRMYRLGDGEFFWYFEKWDHHGNVIGKIYDPLDARLQNKIVHRSLLEDAELVPSGEEPWTPARRCKQNSNKGNLK